MTIVNLTAVGDVGCSDDVAKQVEIQIKYQGYITRQQQEISQQQRCHNTVLPDDFDYQHIPGLSAELIEKLTQIKTEYHWPSESLFLA